MDIHTDEAGYVALVTALVSVVVAAGLIQITASNTKHKIQSSNLEEAITNTAQLQDAWTTALEGYIQDNKDSWPVGHIESVSTSDLQPDHLVDGFGDNGKTPFGQTFVASVKKPGDTVQAVVFQSGSMDPKVFRDAGMTKTPQTVRSVAYRVQQTYMNNFSTSERVPAVLPANSTTADGGDLFSVDISDHVGSAPSRARVVTLKNFPGLVTAQTSRNVEFTTKTIPAGSRVLSSPGSYSVDIPDHLRTLSIKAVGAGGSGPVIFNRYGTGCSGADGHRGSSTVIETFGIVLSGGRGGAQNQQPPYDRTVSVGGSQGNGSQIDTDDCSGGYASGYDTPGEHGESVVISQMVIPRGVKTIDVTVGEGGKRAGPAGIHSSYGYKGHSGYVRFDWNEQTVHYIDD